MNGQRMFWSRRPGQQALSLVLALALLAGQFLAPASSWQALADEGEEEPAGLPDLQVQSLSVDPAVPAYGSPATVTALVYNAGTGEAGEFTVALTAGGEGAGSSTLPSLAAGAAAEVTFPWTPAAGGEITLAVTADSTEVVEELAEGNNTRTVTVTVAGPPQPGPAAGLAVTAIATSNPAYPVAGTAGTVVVTLHNHGPEEAAGISVSLLAGAEPVGEAQAVASLAAGAETTVEFSWTPAAAGEVVLQAAAESGEAEVCLEQQVTVYPAGAPVVLSTCPAQNEYFDPDTGEKLSITFNKPVQVLRTTPLYRLYYNRPSSSTIVTSAYLTINWNPVAVDEENPCRVLIDLNDYLGKHRNYAVNIYSRSFAAAEDSSQTVTFSTGTVIANLWQFNTGPVPVNRTMGGAPSSALAGEEYFLTLLARDEAGNRLDGLEVSWSTSDAALAQVEPLDDGRGLLQCHANGTVTVTATLAGYYPCSVEVKIREAAPYRLARLWFHQLPASYEAAGQDWLPQVGADGSVYYTTCYRGLGETAFRLRALDSGGHPKDYFLDPVITMQPRLLTVQGVETIYTARDNTLLALNTDDGSVRWQREMPARVVTVPAVKSDGTVIVGCGDYHVYALRPEEEGWLWDFNAEGQFVNYFDVYTTTSTTPCLPFTVDGRGDVYVTTDFKLWAVDGETGQARWSYDLPAVRYLPAVGPDGTVYLGTSSSIYALTPPQAGGSGPAVLWSGTYAAVAGRGCEPLMDEQGNVIFSVKKDAASAQQLILFAAGGENGSPKILREYGYDSRYGTSSGYLVFARRGPEGTVYGLTAVQDSAGAVLAYADEYYGNLQYLRYKGYNLGPDGTLYRLWINAGDVVGVEAVSFYDPSGAEPATLEAETERVVLKPGENRLLYAWVKDQNGVNMLTPQLDWSSSDESVVQVQEGVVSAVQSGAAVITVRISSRPEISAQIPVVVREASVPQVMYFVHGYPSGKALATAEEAKDYRLAPDARLTCQVGEKTGPKSVFIEDQYGELMQRQPILWSLATGGEEIFSMNTSGGLLTKGLSGDEAIPYRASLTALKEGRTTLTATMANYPHISCQVEVEAVSQLFQTLWTVPFEGGWGEQAGWHALGAEKIFSVNANKLKALRKEDGTLLWTAELGSRYGISLGEPVAGPDGTVYVYNFPDNTRLTVAAVDAADGQVKWKFSGEKDGVEKLLAGEEALYVLTLGGKVYKLGLDGAALWAAPLNLGSDNGGILLSPEGRLYAARGEAVYSVADQGLETELYRGQEGDTLTLLEVTPGGELILQRARSGAYDLVSLSATGEEQWTAPDLYPALGASGDGDGNVYVLADRADSPCFYILDQAGRVKFQGALDNSEIAREDFLKPLVSRQGIVYFSPHRLFAVEAATGRVMASVQIHSSYALSPAKSLTLDEEGILYGSFFEVGLAALGQRSYYGEGVQLSPAGKEHVSSNALAELVVKVKNTREEGREVLLQAVVTDQTTRSAEYGQAVARVRLAAGEEQEVSLGLRLPSLEGLAILVTARDPQDQDRVYGSYLEVVNR